MANNKNKPQDEEREEQQDGDLGDMLQEQRILLQGAQVLTAFLIILPFNQGFANIDEREKWVYLATFLCSVTSLVLLTAPAAHHRLARPLEDRERFKNIATRIIVIALVPLSLAISLSAFLVLAQVVGITAGLVAGIVVGILILISWWIVPLALKKHL